MEFIDHISLIDIKDKKILLCHSKGKTKWQLPGGKREPGETDEQTLIRECKEELGVEIIPESIKLFEEIEGQAFGKDNGIVVKIKMFNAKWNGEVKASNEIEKVDYLQLSDVSETSELGWKYLNELKDRGLIK